MALLEVHFKSDILEYSTAMTVILPERPCPLEGGRWPALYLLHGYGGDHTVWHRRTALERYVMDMNLAVIMPAAQNSFYTDMTHGPKYWQYISEELPALCERMFPLSTAREHRFAAGLSMGGYGALKLGLRHPERFAAVASLSGAVDMAAYAGEPGHTTEQRDYFINVFGSVEALTDSSDDLPAVARRLLASGDPAPRIYMACGTEDFLYKYNRAFVESFGEAFAITYEEGPGAHEWSFWDKYIQRVLAWLPL